MIMARVAAVWALLVALVACGVRSEEEWCEGALAQMRVAEGEGVVEIQWHAADGSHEPTHEQQQQQQQQLRFMALTPPRHAFSWSCTWAEVVTRQCVAQVPRTRRTRAVYVTAPGCGGASRRLAPGRRGSDAAATRRSEAAAGAQPSVGILYEGWHAYAANAMVDVARQGGVQLTVEDVVRGNGVFNLSDVWTKYGVQGDTDGFYYQSKPALGFYCIYRAREGETPIVPNCANISQTLHHHAAELTGAGIDFVVTDSTNLGSPSDQADVLQVRPTEVLFEEWASLRKQGQPTPAIAVWQVVTPGSTLWKSQLQLYNNVSYTDLVLTRGGKKVFFIPDNPTLKPDATIIKAIESNGGRNDVTVVKMWADFATSGYDTGTWGFFSPCRDASGAYTTTVSTLAQCNQAVTTGSPLGTAIAVSPSYQLNYGSVPFGAPGKLRGFTFRSQFLTALSAMPDNIMISSYNEFIAQPQPNPFKQPFAFSEGTPWDNTGRTSLWVDTYGWGIGRDIEPSIQGGDSIFQLMASCLRVARLNAAAGTTGCNVANETCCDSDATESYNAVWSLGITDDNLLTTSTVELQHLLQVGWKEHCNPYNGPTAFCVDASLLSTFAALQGPFLLSAQGGTGFKPLYRCYTGSRHFFSPQSDCEGQTVEGVLGYMSTSRSTDFPRGIRRCRVLATDTYYQILDGTCNAGDASEGFYGFVF